MKSSLRALLSGVIDYAGLFPPAQLPLEQAIQNDTAYRKGPDAWMLGRFVCPAAKLAQLTTFPPLSVVGQGGADVDELLNGLRNNVVNLTVFRRRQPAAEIGAYEIRLNDLVIRFRSTILKEVFEQAKVLADAPVGVSSVFYEVECVPESVWQKSVKQAQKILEERREQAAKEGRALRPRTDAEIRAMFIDIGVHRWTESVNLLVSALAASRQPQKGLKIRCGGASASSVPTTDDVAFALAACCKAAVPAKFTAGLHHPLRHHDNALGVKTHGFLNVFVAGVMAHARGLDANALKPIVEEEDAASFHFDDSGLRWKDMHATTDQIIDARKCAVVSFGSCSFDEPREDLRALGLLD